MSFCVFPISFKFSQDRFVQGTTIIHKDLSSKVKQRTNFYGALWNQCTNIYDNSEIKLTMLVFHFYN